MAAVEAVGGAVPHPATAALASMLVTLAEATADALGGVDDDATESDLVDQISLLERLRGAVVATQAAAMVRLTRARMARENPDGADGRGAVDGRRRVAVLGRGLVEEIGLACRVSPSVAARRLAAARAWWSDLPHTYTALATGRLHERVAAAVVSETRHLDPVRRREVDAHLHPDPSATSADAADLEVGTSLVDLGVRAALAVAAKTAYRVDPRAYVARGRTEREDRHVTLRPAPDTMSWLSGYLPVEQGVACLAALKRHTDTAVAAGDDRTRGQIMADTLVERLTGQARACDVNVEIQLIVPTRPSNPTGLTEPAGAADDVDPDASAPLEGITGLDHSGTDQDEGAALLSGVGLLPMALARELVDASAGRTLVRTLQQSPGGQVVAIGARRRFTGSLADLLVARDQTCREPFCDAPIRHLDHVQRHADGGPTSLPNGRGLCARHNLTREQPGWNATVVHEGLGTQPHTVVTTTPTGHRYTSRAPDPP